MDQRRDLRLLSVVVPLHNEQETLEELHRRVAEALAGERFELILVNDGSSDATEQIMERLTVVDPRVVGLSLARNFGHQAALTAGLDHARGDAVVMMDGDLQDPPEVIVEMLAKWREGADVVCARREWREGETWFKLATARWFYRVFERLTGLDLEQSGDFRLIDRQSLDSLLTLRERNRFLRGMTKWIGGRQTSVSYRRDPRYGGETKFTLGRMVRFSLDAISSFSYVPLQFATLLGFAFSSIAFLCIPLVIVARVTGQFVPGVSSTIIAVLLLGGIQLITVGLIGEYVGRIYDEVKQRPLYLVRHTLGADTQRDVPPARWAEVERIA